uniref:Uncharacterized protein n=1 Tax=Avena sativa TaxID=4498 RepID=A0ACD5Z3Y4_AVESA
MCSILLSLLSQFLPRIAAINTRQTDRPPQQPYARYLDRAWRGHSRHLSPMYSCSSDRDRDRMGTGAAERCAVAFGAKYQPYDNTAATTKRAAAGQVVPPDSQQPQPLPRRPRRKHSASRRSSTTVVATDVSNFRAMVQELTGFPPAAIFRPLPRRAHAAAASHSLLAAALQGRSSDAAGTAGANGGPDLQASVQPLMTHPTPGVFVGLDDLGSPEFDGWPDLSFE